MPRVGGRGSGSFPLTASSAPWRQVVSAPSASLAGWRCRSKWTIWDERARPSAFIWKVGALLVPPGHSEPSTGPIRSLPLSLLPGKTRGLDWSTGPLCGPHCFEEGVNVWVVKARCYLLLPGRKHTGEIALWRESIFWTSGSWALKVQLPSFVPLHGCFAGKGLGAAAKGCSSAGSVPGLFVSN